MKHLGYANDWYNNTPAELKKCIEAGHTRSCIEIGHCLHKFKCDICQIEYEVDSSD